MFDVFNRPDRPRNTALIRLIALILHLRTSVCLAHPTSICIPSLTHPFLSFSSSFDPSRQPPSSFFPPFPPEHVLRSGKLNMGGATLGAVGETKDIDGAGPSSDFHHACVCAVILIGMRLILCHSGRPPPRPDADPQRRWGFRRSSYSASPPDGAEQTSTDARGV